VSHADGQTDRHDETNSRFRNSANVPKEGKVVCVYAIRKSISPLILSCVVDGGVWSTSRPGACVRFPVRIEYENIWATETLWTLGRKVKSVFPDGIWPRIAHPMASSRYPLDIDGTKMLGD